MKDNWLLHFLCLLHSPGHGWQRNQTPESVLIGRRERERERERDAINEHAHLCSHPHIQIHNLPISHPLESLHKSHCSPTHKMVWTLHHPFVVVYTSGVISPAAASHSTINRALTKHQHTHTAHKAHRVPQSWLILLIVLATYNPFTQKERIWYISTSDLASYIQCSSQEVGMYVCTVFCGRFFGNSL